MNSFGFFSSPLQLHWMEERNELTRWLSKSTVCVWGWVYHLHLVHPCRTSLYENNRTGNFKKVSYFKYFQWMPTTNCNERGSMYIYIAVVQTWKKKSKYKQLLNTGSSRKTKLLMLPKNYLQFLRNNYISLLFYHNHKMNTNYNTKSWKIDFYTYVNLRVYRTNITTWQVVKFKRFYIASLAKQI